MQIGQVPLRNGRYNGRGGADEESDGSRAAIIADFGGLSGRWNRWSGRALARCCRKRRKRGFFEDAKVSVVNLCVNLCGVFLMVIIKVLIRILILLDRM